MKYRSDRFKHLNKPKEPEVLDKMDSAIHDITKDIDTVADGLAAPEYTHQFFEVDPDTMPEVEFEPSEGTAVNPKFKPTPERRLRVRMGIVAGLTAEDMAKVMGMNRKTLVRHYRQDIDCAYQDMTTMVTGKLIEKIREGDNASIIFYLRNRAKWTAKTEHVIEHRIRETRTKDEIEQELLELGISQEKLLDLIED